MLLFRQEVKKRPTIGVAPRVVALLPDISNLCSTPPSDLSCNEVRCRPPAGHLRTLHRGGLQQGIHTMADDLSKRGPQDATRIDVNESHEVRYWTQTLGVTEAQLRLAVAAAGVEVKDIRTYLGKP
jgi:hypothetical protein